ncbi:MAG: PEP-CTERM system TPR-repeat protein PrsT [Burkholderiaceae bacterium]|nr:PEP-CTERM system TPR-repeat protein PrsT [Rhodoferax sp.]MCP5269913.1 PEP-CTERM system TPR-repeat protein PrsT [Burkholderiaceae bacterium]
MKPRLFSRRLGPGLLLALCLAAGQATAADPQASRFYEDALQRFDKRDFKGAIIQLKNALERDRALLPVHLLMGRSLLEDGQPAAAEAALAEAMRLGVARAEAVLPLAQSVLDQGRSAVLLADSRFSVPGLPPETQYRLLLLKSSAAADLGNAREAMAMVDEARKLRPEDPDSWLAEVTLQIRSRAYDRAIAAADKALSLAPTSANVIYQRAQIDHVRGALKSALEGYGRALSKSPDHVEALLSRAGLLIDQGRVDEARQDVTRLREVAAADPRGAFLSALLAEKSGDLEGSRKALREVTSLVDPVPIDYIRYKAQVLMLAGLAHYGLGEREAAIPYLEAYRNLDPRGGVSKLLAQILLAEGKVEPAMQALDDYLQANPRDAQAQTLMASALMASGRTGRATQVARSGLQAQENPALRAALGLSLIGGGELAGAVRELESALKQDPGQFQAAAALVGLYLQRDDPTKALSLARQLVQRRPKDARAQTVLAQARMGNRDAAGARAALEAALTLDPGLRSAQVQMARLDAAQGRFDAAQARLNGLLLKNERDAELLFELAALAQRRGRGDEAQRLLEQAILHGSPQDMRPVLALADLHLKAGRAPEAIAVVKAMATKLPSDPRAQVAVARMQLAGKDKDGARVSLGAATRLANFDPELQLEIALLQIAAGNLDGAAYSLDKSLNGRPDFLPALAALAEVETRSGRLDQAEGIARRILEKHPTRALGQTLLGDVAWARQQSSVAIERYRQAHRAEPSTTTLLKLSAALEIGGKPAAANELLVSWARSKPDDLTAARALAGVQLRRGDHAAARTTLERLLKQRPGDAGLLNELANVLVVLDPKAALPVAEQAMAAGPGSAAITDTLGWVLFKNGQRDRALQLLRDARLRQPGNPTIRYHLAAVLADGGRHEEARTELQAALAAAPRFEGDAAARELLKSLP